MTSKDLLMIVGAGAIVGIIVGVVGHFVGLTGAAAGGAAGAVVAGLASMMRKRGAGGAAGS